MSSLPLKLPYRLDLTVEALQRVPGNLVDVVVPDGRYLRALDAETVVEVRQRRTDELDVRIVGEKGERHLSTLAAMLGTQVDLRQWYRRSAAIPWVARLATALRGLKPPRYPNLWEAICHAITFQQVSIVAAGAIMQRFVQRFSAPVTHDGLQLYPFPRPEAIVVAGEDSLRSVGLSRSKASYLTDAARSIAAGTVDIEHLETLRGVGPWSAAVILLRGLGRLDVFPPMDSGAAKSIKLLSGDPATDVESVLEALGSVRGMLYFHLLLGRRTPSLARLEN